MDAYTQKRLDAGAPPATINRETQLPLNKASLSLAATEENIRLHLQFTVYEERRHPFTDIFSHGLPCGAGES